MFEDALQRQPGESPFWESFLSFLGDNSVHEQYRQIRREKRSAISLNLDRKPWEFVKVSISFLRVFIFWFPFWGFSFLSLISVSLLYLPSSIGPFWRIFWPDVQLPRTFYTMMPQPFPCMKAKQKKISPMRLQRMLAMRLPLHKLEKHVRYLRQAINFLAKRLVRCLRKRVGCPSTSGSDWMLANLPASSCAIIELLHDSAAHRAPGKDVFLLSERRNFCFSSKFNSSK